MDTAQSTAVRYAADPKVSRFTVRAFAGGFLAGLGHNPTFAVRGFTCEVTFMPDFLADASVHFRMSASSLSLEDNVSAKDRNEIERKTKDEVLEAERFSEISFESTKIATKKVTEGQYEVDITGNLTLHGVAQGLSFLAKVVMTGDMLRGYGEFTVRQTDYGIKLVSVAGGALKVKDELECSFDMVFRKQG
jgi:polyisoprenoid-binding protein YceI